MWHRSSFSLSSSSSSSSSSPSMTSSSLTVVSLLMAVVILLDGSGVGVVVSAWPGGSAMYECCCPDSYGCRKSCFMCRNNDFVCNCDQCSCYHDYGYKDIMQAPKEAAPKNDLLSLLLRNGAGKKGRNWGYGAGR